MKGESVGETLTNPDKMGENGGCGGMAAAAAALDPLGVMPEVGHLLPGASGGIDLVAEAKKPEGGAVPLKNRRREEFCRVLTGWGGDGRRKRNCEAYEAVYGKGGATARTQSSWLLANPEVKARVEWLERKVAEAKRHDYRAAQQEIDELRLGLVERAKRNAKLAGLALQAARDFEAAHGLNEEPARTETTEVQAMGGDALGGVRAVLARVVRKTEVA